MYVNDNDIEISILIDMILVVPNFQLPQTIVYDIHNTKEYSNINHISKNVFRLFI